MKHVSWIRQLALAVVLFTLGTLAYWWEFKQKPQNEEREEQVKRAFQIKDTPIKSVRLVNGNQTVAFTCSDFAAKLCKPTDHSKWEMLEPKKLKADDANVNSLLSTLSHLSPTETIDLKKETPEKKATLLKEYGLDEESRKKAAQVQISTEKGDTTLYIGHAHPIGETFFALADENRILLLPSYFKSNLEHDLTYWRDKKLSTLASHEVESFHLQSSNDTSEKLSAERKEGQWILRGAQGEFPGDGETIEQLLSSITTLTAKNFVTDSKTDAQAKSILKGLKPVVTLTLQKEKGAAKETPEPIHFTFYQPKADKLYVTVSNLDPLFEVDPSVKDRIKKGPNQLRLTKLISMMDRFSAKHLEFSGKPIGAAPLVLEQVDGKWRNVATQAEVPAGKVQALLEKLSGNQVRDFLGQKTLPTGEKEGLVVTLGDEKIKDKKKFIFWKNDKKVYGRNLQSNQKEGFMIEPSVQDVLPWSKTAFDSPPVPAPKDPTKQ